MSFSIQQPVIPCKIQDKDVHIWQVSLDQRDVDVAGLACFLSPEESARADKYLFPRDKRRFIVARGFLRKILGSYLDLPAEQIVFDYNQFGKPRLRNEELLQFNVSHSNEIAIYAIAINRSVGIDIEYCRPLMQISDLVKCLSPYEQEQLQQLKDADQLSRFYICWTRKEAVIKAIGKGLFLPLDRFDVTLLPTDPPKLLYIAEEEERDKWTLCDLSVDFSYVAALAVEKRCEKFQLHYKSLSCI